MEYNDYVIRSILANNKFGITIVNDLLSQNTLPFVKEDYPIIENLIRSNNDKAIPTYTNSSYQNREYLEIMSFADQIGKKYIVTVYDSDALEQDPQVIEIYLIK